MASVLDIGTCSFGLCAYMLQKACVCESARTEMRYHKAKDINFALIYTEYIPL